MRSKKKQLKRSRVYLILDEEVSGRERIERILKAALKGAVDIVQYRDKTTPSAQMIKNARRLFKICRSHNIPFIINDRLDVALSLDADGLHLGQDDMPVAIARTILGKNKIIGLSCHDLNQIKKAQNEPCDYLGFGPVFKTATKPDASPRGVLALKKAIAASNLPIFAIGGITEQSVLKLKDCVNLRVACIREICLARNPRTASKKLKKGFSSCTKN